MIPFILSLAVTVVLFVLAWRHDMRNRRAHPVFNLCIVMCALGVTLGFLARWLLL